MKLIRALSVSRKLCLLALAFAIIFSPWFDSPFKSVFVAAANEKDKATLYSYKVVNTFSHDPESFTQGLFLEDGILYESTGLNGKSAVKKIDLKTGKVIQSRNMQDKFFGEGLTIVNDKIFQITWRSKTGFVYDKDSLEILRTFSYKTQGWGITYDGKYLIISDGSEILYFMDPKSFVVVGKLEVYNDNGKVSKLNELEYIDGEIYANIWGKDLIARIDPKTGYVNSWIDLTGILSKEDRKGKEDVLNGIAYNPENNSLLVTGKLWPKIFEIKIIEKNQQK
ncbi:MAG: glutaminyl-peptide cyclotransferase [Thermodesulfobacteriota bacterium]|nr:MAG: glutaminyl-peptide cyclotransferase [Thermodesulfobacteriota bacterium]